MPVGVLLVTTTCSPLPSWNRSVELITAVRYSCTVVARSGGGLAAVGP